MSMSALQKTLRLIVTIVTQIPLVVAVTVLHLLRLSPSAPYLDLQSELLVSVIRSLCHPNHRISSIQRFTTRDYAIRGRMWVAKYTAPAPPEKDLQSALVSAVEGLRANKEQVLRYAPELVPVEAEWTGYRSDAEPDSPQPDLFEKEKFKYMEKECSSPTTVLFMHGGAFYLLDPAMYRSTMKKLAKLTGGRCYSIRYRLAPQNPFPAAILDVLMSYMTLLYPPPGAFHGAVKPEHIVFVGDSAGGNLALAAIQVLMELGRQGRKVRWFGRDRKIPLPAGIALNSPWLDMTLSMPSWKHNARFDYLPSCVATERFDPPCCSAWPTDPPRHHIYADDDLLDHPLVSLILNKHKNWVGAPPVFVCAGWELVSDENRFFVDNLHRAGVPVVFEEYEGMPHCFAMVLTRIPAARKCFNSWSRFIQTAVEAPQSIQSSATGIKARSLDENQLELGTLSVFDEDQVEKVIHGKMALGKAGALYSKPQTRWTL